MQNIDTFHPHSHPHSSQRGSTAEHTVLFPIRMHRPVLSTATSGLLHFPTLTHPRLCLEGLAKLHTSRPCVQGLPTSRIYPACGADRAASISLKSAGHGKRRSGRCGKK